MTHETSSLKGITIFENSLKAKYNEVTDEIRKKLKDDVAVIHIRNLEIIIFNSFKKRGLKSNSRLL